MQRPGSSAGSIGRYQPGPRTRRLSLTALSLDAAPTSVPSPHPLHPPAAAAAAGGGEPFGFEGQSPSGQQAAGHPTGVSPGMSPGLRSPTPLAIRRQRRSSLDSSVLLAAQAGRATPTNSVYSSLNNLGISAPVPHPGPAVRAIVAHAGEGASRHYHSSGAAGKAREGGSSSNFSAGGIVHLPPI
mmetsp:Transcript_20972/g.53312  ORF Transcript_20972/g.53312 Transcript_20972/m.53312 type:complete len:185 (-) Transcript_20972:620-1174(-)